MPVSFEITSSTGSYQVVIAPGLIETTVAEGGEQIWLVDDFFANDPQLAGVNVVMIHAEETAKSLDRMTDMIVSLRDRRATRTTTLVAVGGGVVQDISTFIGSIYMRGVPWIYVPTTLLSMVDSCIGGKSSINVGKYKNIVGTFHPPVTVLIDPMVIATLSPEARAGGLCEAAKICLAHGPQTFADYLAVAASPQSDAEAMGRVIALSLGAKKWFIEVDEFDQAERLLLNFGHTFGHALEAASHFCVSHGIAVGLGMLAALHLGEEMGRDYAGAPHVARFREHIIDLVSVVEDLSEVLTRVDPAALIDAFQSDKKHTREVFTVLIVTAEGMVERKILPRDSVSETMIGRAFARMLADWTKPRQPIEA